MKIEKLTTYKTTEDGCYWTSHPNTEDFMNKINEIIDCIEFLAELLEECGDLT